MTNIRMSPGVKHRHVTILDLPERGENVGAVYVFRPNTSLSSYHVFVLFRAPLKYSKNISMVIKHIKFWKIYYLI